MKQLIAISIFILWEMQKSTENIKHVFIAKWKNLTRQFSQKTLNIA